MSNDDVKELQEALFLCGFFPGGVDGMMGPATRKAVTEFQSANGLTADGDAGPNTRRKISEKLGAASARALTLMPKFLL